MSQEDGLSSIILLEKESLWVAGVIEFHQVVLSNPFEVLLTDLGRWEEAWVLADVCILTCWCVSKFVIVGIVDATCCEFSVIYETSLEVLNYVCRDINSIVQSLECIARHVHCVVDSQAYVWDSSIERILHVVTKVLFDIRDIWLSVINGHSNILCGAINYVRNIGSSVIESIADILDAVGNDWDDLLSGVRDTVSDVDGVVYDINSFLDCVSDGIIHKVSDIWDSIVHFINEVFCFFSNITGGIVH